MSVAETGRRPDLVIGVGHRFRCDDGAGPAVASELAKRGYPAVVHEGEGSALLDLWEGCRRVVVVDAVTGDAPGTVLWFNANTLDMDAHRFVHSTHDIGLPEAVAFGQSLDRLPGRLDVVGIAGSTFSIGERMSPTVSAAVDKVVTDLAAEFDN